MTYQDDGNYMEGRTMEEPQIDIEQLLEEGKILQIRPQGYSMYPLLVPGRDEVILEKTDPSRAKRGDVLLYRRAGQGILVLHRVYRHNKKGLYMVGDNQTVIEGPIALSQVKGRMTACIRNGKKLSVKHPCYVIGSRLWLALRVFRPVIGWTIHRIIQRHQSLHA